MRKYFLDVNPFLANYHSTGKAVVFLVFARKLLDAHVVIRLEENASPHLQNMYTYPSLDPTLTLNSH